MLDRLDLALLNSVQRHGAQTAEELAEHVPLSPSAIARRLRRLRSDGWIERTIALVSQRLTDRYLRALVSIQLSEHADLDAKARLEERLRRSHQVQFCYETTGAFDMVALFLCGSMAEFNELATELLTVDSTVRRYESSFVKREIKFAPFVDLQD
jgi:Lrp/AsnC family leucine-responsive transcriptional regulator